MPHSIRACLFDLDGVVVFTDKYHYLSWKRLADEEGWDFDEDVNHLCRGIPRMASLQVILDHNNIDLPEAEKTEVATRKNQYYIDLLQEINDSDLYPGIVAFLKQLTAENIKLGLCSSSKNAELVLDKLDLRKYFGAIVTGNDIVNAKPHPEIFLKGAEMLGIPPSACVVFEDAVSGIDAASAAGAKPVGVGKRELLPNATEVILDYAKINLDSLLEDGRL